MEEKFVITIGRQLGSGGKQVGEMLSTQLGISCYDKELIHIASKESGLCPELFEQADEKTGFSLISGLFDLSSFGRGDFYTNNYLSNESLFKIQSDVIRNLSEQQSCIFVGRCADYILRDHPRRLSVFITASIKDRIQRISKHQNLPEDKIKTLIEQTDKKRAAYYNYYSNKIWGMSTSYDLCLNSSTLGVEEVVDCILHFVQRL
ncbi:MAG: cytidylate kinase-like family protein [Dysgonamonadaceae bacterium]|jgi:cytidylate kinase|nr:cytidylate kinase-like family protein [Dysgonamonadaceae bacterium]